MKINFLLLTIITAAITSCSTAYRSGQTPDDVYYSPARLQTDDVRRDDDHQNRNDNSVYSSPEDREIRRRVRNRRYRRYDDRYDYPYGYNNGHYGNYGNPKYGTTQPNTQKPRTTNLGAYTPNTTMDSTSSTNPKSGKINTGITTNPVRTFGSPDNSSNNKGSAVGNLIRKVLSGDGVSSDNGNNSRSSNPSRTFDNNRSSSNNNSSTNSGTKSSTTETKSTSAPVRTFKNN